MDDFIGIYDNIFSDEHCDKLINFVHHLDEHALMGGDNSDVQKHLRDHTTFNAAFSYNTTHGSWLGTNFLPYICNSVNDYLMRYSVLGKNKFLLYDVKIKKIRMGGGFHNWHYENSRLGYCSRYFVVQAYLNDDFEGGETEFLYLNKRINAKKGRVIIFPAGYTHTHRGNPPIGNTKYIITSWGMLQDSFDE